MNGNSFVSKKIYDEQDVCCEANKSGFSTVMLATSFAVNALIVAYVIISTLIA